MDNGQIARAFFAEVWSRGKLDFIDQNFDRSFQSHETLEPNGNLELLKNKVQMYRSAFPDVVVAADELTEAGDKVLVRWTARGTHRGNLFGKPGTGKRFEVQGLSVLIFRNGKIIEEWTQWDAFGMLRQLGIVAELAQPGAQPSA